MGKGKARRMSKGYWDAIESKAREERVVCFLQNAWSPVYAGREWPRRSWLRALRDSRSGTRLRILVPNPAWCHNTTPVVSEKPSGRPPADRDHIRGILRDRMPGIVIACGRQAEMALVGALGSMGWDGSSVGLIAVPHPAARLVTNALYQQARAELAEQRRDANFRRWVAFRQRREFVETECLLDASA